MSSDPSRPAAANRPRVLVVDDNADLAHLMTLLLRHCGFDVQAVLGGHRALATARSFRPHFILLDIGLPGLDGYQVAEPIRSELALKTAVIMAVSAYGPGVHPERCRRAGFDHHLTKPVYIDDLLPLLVPRPI
jgi:two-component system CheB/CheR fusion protein